MLYRAKRTVNLGGGHLLEAGQTTNLAEGVSIPGLEPVLEREPGANTLERQGAERNLDAPTRGRLIT
jgi:hypothetical protein